MAINNTKPLSKEQAIKHAKLQKSLPYFSKNVLKIADKSGNLSPLIFNQAQIYLHNRLEDQLQRTGKVRAIIVKGRQQGCSTYVAARFYHKTTWNPYKNAFILAHQADSTQALFNMVERYKENAPKPMQPGVDVENSKQLVFKNKSQYRVGTAGSKSVGRGGTNQYIHGSEVAFYEAAADIQTGLMQTVPNAPGTEIILESTANGLGNFFHKKAMSALNGSEESGEEWELIFIPWFWQDEYYLSPPEGFSLTEEERKLKSMYKLSDGQLYWRRAKMREFDEEWMFKQEYPFTVQEAFQTSGVRLFDPITVQEARHTKILHRRGPVVIGCDPARTGDRTAIVVRQGREILHKEKHLDMKAPRLAAILAFLTRKYNATKGFIDAALGYAVADILQESGYGHVWQPVAFAERPLDPRYLNKRAEMALLAKEWLQSGEGPVSLPDDDEFITDVLAIPDYLQNTRGLIHLVPKAKIKEEYGKSPDYFDAFILTFAYPVKESDDLIGGANKQRRTTMSKEGGTPSKTIRRFRGRNKHKEVSSWPL